MQQEHYKKEHDEYRKLVYRAGTIPYHIDESSTIRMLFMKPSDSTFGGDAYQIGKGRVEDGEDHRSAALREAKEELGLFIGNTILTEEVGVFMGRTTMFIAKINPVKLTNCIDCAEKLICKPFMHIVFFGVKKLILLL